MYVEYIFLLLQKCSAQRNENNMRRANFCERRSLSPAFSRNLFHDYAFVSGLLLNALKYEFGNGKGKDELQ